MHDVDLLPMNDNLSYKYPNVGPYHISSPNLHPRYHYSTFIGGILLINRYKIYFCFICLKLTSMFSIILTCISIIGIISCW